MTSRTITARTSSTARRTTRTVGLALVLLVGTAGAVTAPAAAGTGVRAVVPAPPDAHQISGVEITGDAVYLSTSDDYGYSSSVYRRSVLDQHGTVALGNLQRVATGVELSPVVGAQDSVAYLDHLSGVVHVRSDDGTATQVPSAWGSPTGLGGGWLAMSSEVHPLTGDAERAFGLSDRAAHLRPADPWFPDAAIEWFNDIYGWGTSDVSASAVAWTDEGVSPRHGTRAQALFAQPLDASGPVGEPVLLEAAFQHEDEDDEWVAAVEVTDTWVVWAVHSDAGHVVRWVPTSDLSAVPSERPLAVAPSGLSVDGDRIAVVGEEVPDDGQPVVEVSDLTPDGPVLLRVPFSNRYVRDVELGGGLLAVVWFDFESGHNGLEVTTLDGEPVEVLAPFADVSLDNPRSGDIDWLVAQGITTGYADGSFRPYAPVTRQAMAAFVYRSAGSPAWTPPVVSPFADLAPGSPFYAEITWLADQGITTGYDGPGDSVLFRPATSVSRQAMAAFLHRFAGAPAVTAPGASPFLDVPVGGHFYAEIAWLAGQGISTGTDVGGAFAFRPADAVSRQAMAAFLHRLDDVLAPV